MYFGKIKNTKDEWGFDVFTETFESYKSIDSETHMKIIEEANAEGKIIKGDKKGNPILVEPPPPTEEEIKQLHNFWSQTRLQKWKYDEMKNKERYNIKPNYHFA